MTHSSTFRKYPQLSISSSAEECALGWNEILDRLSTRADAKRIAVECYPGIPLEPIRDALLGKLPAEIVLDSRSAMLPPATLESKFASILGDDPVFGFMTPVSLDEFFDPEKVRQARRAADAAQGNVLAIGPGAAKLLSSPDLLLYVNGTRWQIQQWQRAGMAPNLGLENAQAPASQLYKRAFFLDWRTADRWRHELFSAVDYWIDGNHPDRPAMLSGKTFQSALAQSCLRPFSLVPFFDPGPWGGQWMRRVFGLPDGPRNYAWCFNCVPEENSLVLGFGQRCFELPAQLLVHEYPLPLLGERVVSRFGAEFPIRFDFLDTVEGGNLSLQVHPLRSYIREQFGMAYTQEESYYMLDAAADATVFLGLQNNCEQESMIAELQAAQNGGPAFRVEKFVHPWPAHKHDHFLIPPGTIHCSGKNSMVLEISATPYIFTFKLWDWGRMGLDGRPRPIHLEHGLRNIQWDRTANWVERNLVNCCEPIAEGDGWREERTGLHRLEFLETRRHWFTAPVAHQTQGNLNVLNLVEGDAAIVESPTGTFPPFPVNYAETFVVPAAAGAYTIRPAGKATTPLATIKAFVREA